MSPPFLLTSSEVDILTLVTQKRSPERLGGPSPPASVFLLREQRRRQAGPLGIPRWKEGLGWPAEQKGWVGVVWGDTDRRK